MVSYFPPPTTPRGSVFPPEPALGASAAYHGVDTPLPRNLGGTFLIFFLPLTLLSSQDTIRIDGK